MADENFRVKNGMVIDGDITVSGDMNVTGTITGSNGLQGDMDTTTYDPQGISGDAFLRDNHTGSLDLGTSPGSSTYVPVNDEHLTNKLFVDTALSAHSGDTSVHYQQSNISITESQISDLQAYESTANKNAFGGYAGLDGTGKLDAGQLPPLAITSTYVAVDETAQLALTVQEGDVAVRSDETKSYIALNDTNLSMGDWQELLTPTDTVLSVAGKSGVVTLSTADLTDGANILTVNGNDTVTGPMTYSGISTFSGVTNVTNILYAKNTDQIDLVGVSGGVIIGGDGTGTHLAFDPQDIQAKTDATSTATLTLNKLGGAVYYGSNEVMHVGGGQTIDSDLTMTDGFSYAWGDGSTEIVGNSITDTMDLIAAGGVSANGNEIITDVGGQTINGSVNTTGQVHIAPVSDNAQLKLERTGSSPGTTSLWATDTGFHLGEDTGAGYKFEVDFNNSIATLGGDEILTAAGGQSITGDIAATTFTQNGVLLDDQYVQSTPTTAITVAGAGWYKVALSNFTSGRGVFDIQIETVGGLFNPERLHIWGNKSSNNNPSASNSLFAETSSTTYWSDVRLVVEPTENGGAGYGYVEVYFNQSMASDIVITSKVHGFITFKALTGALTEDTGATSIISEGPLSLTSGLSVSGNIQTNGKNIVHTGGGQTINGDLTITGTPFLHPNSNFVNITGGSNDNSFSGLNVYSNWDNTGNDKESGRIAFYAKDANTTNSSDVFATIDALTTSWTSNANIGGSLVFNTSSANSLVNRMKIASTGEVSVWDGTGLSEVMHSGGGQTIGGDLTVSGDLSLDATLTMPYERKLYTYEWDNRTNTNWVKIADVTVGTGFYRAQTIRIDVNTDDNNFGAGMAQHNQTYYAICYRSAGTQDSPDSGWLIGPDPIHYHEFIRLIKVSLGVYEIHYKPYSAYDSNRLRVQTLYANAGGGDNMSFIEVTDSSPTATITGIEYNVQVGTNTVNDYFDKLYSTSLDVSANLSVTGNQTIGGDLTATGYVDYESSIRSPKVMPTVLDYNTVTEGGHYQVETEFATNSPYDGDEGSYTLHVLPSASSSRVTQMITSESIHAASLLLRSKVGSTWSPWTKVITEDYAANTQAQTINNSLDILGDLTVTGTLNATVASDVVDDTTPQLGGSLDTNGNQITNNIVGSDLIINTIVSANASAAGDIRILPGANASTGDPGSVYILGGDSVGSPGSLTTGGEVRIAGGSSSSADAGDLGGNVTLEGGPGETGGRARIIGGNGLQYGGIVDIVAGDGVSVGGSIILRPGIKTTDQTQDGYIEFAAPGGAASNSTIVRYMAKSGYYVGIKSPDTVSTARTWELPQDDPTTSTGKALMTSSTGVMSFGTPEDLGEFEYAFLPSASANANKWALVTDAVGGRTVVRSDGVNWKVITVEGGTVVPSP